METLYRTYGSMVLRRARTLLGDEHAAQDMVQEVFMKAIRAFPSFR
ncbi:MAG: RNA polymerase sigma factor, partial [Polyangia bacterium]